MYAGRWGFQCWKNEFPLRHDQVRFVISDLVKIILSKDPSVQFLRWHIVMNGQCHQYNLILANLLKLMKFSLYLSILRSIYKNQTKKKVYLYLYILLISVALQFLIVSKLPAKMVGNNYVCTITFIFNVFSLNPKYKHWKKKFVNGNNSAMTRGRAQPKICNVSFC